MLAFIESNNIRDGRNPHLVLCKLNFPDGESDVGQFIHIYIYSFIYIMFIYIPEQFIYIHIYMYVSIYVCICTHTQIFAGLFLENSYSIDLNRDPRASVFKKHTW